MKLDHVTVLTGDLGRLVAFYGALPGFTVRTPSGDGYAEATNSGITIGLFDREAWQAAIGADVQGTAGGVMLQFTVGDVDGAFADAVAAGARVVAEPQDLPWGSRSAFVADPDGNVLELYRWG